MFLVMMIVFQAAKIPLIPFYFSNSKVFLSVLKNALTCTARFNARMCGKNQAATKPGKLCATLRNHGLNGNPYPSAAKLPICFYTDFSHFFLTFSFFSYIWTSKSLRKE
jgi:hypothetical protein